MRKTKHLDKHQPDEKKLGVDVGEEFTMVRVLTIDFIVYNSDQSYKNNIFVFYRHYKSNTTSSTITFCVFGLNSFVWCLFQRAERSELTVKRWSKMKEKSKQKTPRCIY